MEFIYFKGPIEDMRDLESPLQTCSICQRIHEYCFSLDYSMTSHFEGKEKEGKVGCYDCFKEGKFEFWHDSEFGMVDDKGLTKVYNHNSSNPPQIKEQNLIEFRRTPQFSSYQQGLWLGHCNDFMIYIGVWEPQDFYNRSKDGDGRKLFMEMTDKEISFLWDEIIEEEERLTAWYPTYYAFKCRHCEKLRGYWDCD